MIKSFIITLVAILSIAAICIAISLRSALAGFFISLFGILFIFAIVGLFIVPDMICKSLTHDEQQEVLDAEM